MTRRRARLDYVSTKTAPPDGEFSVSLNKGQSPPPGFLRGRTIVLGTAAVIVFFLVVNIVASLHNNTVAAREKSDAALVATQALVVRSWSPTPSGLVERFVAVGDADVAAVRREARRLQVKRRNLGDYGVKDQRVVPGRADLEQSLTKVQVTSRQVSKGLELVYVTKDAELLNDLHLWGAFQQALVTP